jgi:hypothetical protein
MFYLVGDAVMSVILLADHTSKLSQRYINQSGYWKNSRCRGAGIWILNRRIAILD